ncbi:MAG: Calx-beta domain-containing protein [Gammaproteobacteria bacterium]
MNKKIKMLLKNLGMIFPVFILFFSSPAIVSAISFSDVTNQAGGFGEGERWGASWGDVNADGRPDLFVSNHRGYPGIYRNNGDSTFTDIALELDTGKIWSADPFSDMHGATWVDFDNDGDDDLYILLSSIEEAQFMVNENGALIDRAVQAGLNEKEHGRMAAWFDYTGDGLLDVVTTAYSSRLLFQNVNTKDFTLETSAGYSCDRRANYAQLFDLNNNGSLDLICASEGTFPQEVYDTASLPFQDISANFPTASQVNDTVVADFNGDLLSDMFLVRGGLRPSHAAQTDASRVEAWFSGKNGEKAFKFNANGSITLTLHAQDKDIPTHVFTGNAGVTATVSKPGSRITQVTLDHLDPDNQGIKVDRSVWGIYVGYIAAQQRWEIIFSPGTVNRPVYFDVASQEPVSNLVTTGLGIPDKPIHPRLLINSPSGAAYNYNSGLHMLMSCVSAVAGDFDNDMDIDLYLVCRNGVENLPNRYYENLGNGKFQSVVMPYDGEGRVGSGIYSGAGVGETVVTADYDMDGFLDLFITNGLLLQPEFVGGPDQLLKNNGNSNHWIELDLVGTSSNRDAVGAKVYVTAGGKTQLVEQNGQYHRWSQNIKRIHFGLAGNQMANISVHWPGGTVDEYTNIAADKVYVVTEASGIIARQFVNPYTTTIQPGEECGKPNYNASLNKGLFIWKDCNTSTWLMRATGGGRTSNIAFNGEISSTIAFSDSNVISIEANDSAGISANKLTYQFQVKGSDADGIDFDFPAGSDVCLSQDGLTGNTIYIGNKTKAVKTPFSLSGLGPCGTAPPPVPAIMLNTFTVDEAIGSATLTLTLSASSIQPVSVNYTTADISAVSGADYTASSGVITFNPGETTKTLAITIIDDALSESTETFSVGLSNPVGAVLATASTTISITDNEVSSCDAPVFDSKTEKGVFLWKDCTTDVWSMRVLGGGSSTQVLYEGSIDSDQPFSTLSGYSLEGSDLLDNTTDSKRIVYSLKMWNAGQDGAQFSFPTNASVCFDISTSPTGNSVYIGSDRVPVSAPFELASLGACNLLSSINASDVAVSESDGKAVLTVNLSAPSTQLITVDYVTVNGSASAGSDYTAVSGTLTFNPGETTQTVSVAIIDDALSEDAETFSIRLENPQNVVLVSNSSMITITDNELSSCGAPAYDSSSEKGIFLWQDCTTGEWYMRALGGGSTSGVIYTGSISADQDFTSLTEYSLESSDVLDSTSPAKILYQLKMWNAGQDGIQFSYPAGANVCFEVTGSPTGSTVFVGVNRSQIAAPFDMETLAACLQKVSVDISDLTIDEAGGNATLTVSLSAPSSEVVNVNYSTLNGSAIAGTDYTAASGVLSFAAGETSKTISVSITDDAITETAESFTVALSNAVNATLSSASAAVTITDNESVPSATVTDITVGEADGTATLTIALSHASAQSITIDYATADSSAIAGTDYTAASGVLSFAAGEASKTISVSITDDAITETAENFTVALSNAVNATLSSASAVVTIADNESVPSATVTDITVGEAAGTVSLTVALSHVSTQNITIDYATADSSAIAGTDYTAASGVLSFAAGEASKTISVSITDDAITETAESFTVALSNAVNATLSSASVVVTITDNESAPSITVLGMTVTESVGTANLVLSLSGVSALPVTVDYNMTDGAAVSGTDYLPGTGTITFSPGATQQTLSVSIVDDAISENAEDFQVNLTAATNALIGTSTVSITITDNEPLPGLSINDVTVTEGLDANAVFTLSLDRASDNSVTVGYRTSSNPSSSIIFEDNFETSNGWNRNPFGSDTASTGRWERGTPEGTDYNGTRQQLGQTVSGNSDLVTGKTAGSSVGYDDIDNGVTSMRSPAITLPAGQQIMMDFSYYFAYLFNSNTDDFFRVSITGAGTSVVLEEFGKQDQTKAAVWKTHSADISNFAGQTIRILIEAADNGTGSLVEAAIDDLAITAVSNDAASGLDYTAISGSLEFMPGELTKQILVPIINDAVIEQNELFELLLENIANGTIVDNRGRATIINN